MPSPPRSAYCALQVRLLLKSDAGSGGSALARRAASNRPKGNAKPVVVIDDTGTERRAPPVSLDGLESVSDVREALAEAAAEALDEEEALTGEDVAIDAVDSLGRSRSLRDEMALSSALRAKSFRVRLR